MTDERLFSQKQFIGRFFLSLKVIQDIHIKHNNSEQKTTKDLGAS